MLTRLFLSSGDASEFTLFVAGFIALVGLMARCAGVW